MANLTVTEKYRLESVNNTVTENRDRREKTLLSLKIQPGEGKPDCHWKNTQESVNITVTKN